MARQGGRSGYSWAGGLMFGGLRFGGRLGLAVLASPWKLAKIGGRDMLAGGGQILQQLVAIVVWGLLGVLALWVAAMLRNTGIVVLAPVQWALVAAGIVMLATLGLYLRTKGIRSQARLRRALITIEANTSRTAKRMDRVEEAVRSGAGGSGDGEGFDLFGAFRRHRPKTYDEQLRTEQAEWVNQHAREDIPDWMRRMAGEKARRWPWRRK